jgi:hypothetical protein
MTTIAYDGISIAADSAKFGGERLRISTSAQKIFQRDGKVFATAGNFVLQEPWIKWYLDGHDPAKKPAGVHDREDDIGLWVFDGGKLWQFSSELPYPSEVSAPFAMGSGSDFAMGAFRLGDVVDRRVTAKEAVAAAIACDPFSGGPVQVIDLREFQEKAA